MFEKATRGLRRVEVTEFDDVGRTCVATYHVWYRESPPFDRRSRI
jgi:hypothetical protein